MDEIFDKIIKQKEDMSPALKKLAEYILANRSDVSFMTITALAEASGTSEATIVRFCNSLGYFGYPDFKADLQSSVQKRLSIRERLHMSDIAYDNDEHAFIAEIFRNDMNSIQTTLEGLDMDNFVDIMNELLKAKHVVITASRSAQAIGSFLEYYLQMILDDVVMLDKLSVIKEDEVISSFSEDTAVIGITFHRYSKSTIRTMKYAYDRGCVTIALTDMLQSPIVPFSRYSLFAETKLPSLLETFAGPISLVNAMIIYLSKARRPELDKKLELLERRWVDFDVFDE